GFYLHARRERRPRAWIDRCGRTLKSMEPARDLFSATPQLPDVFLRWFAGRGWRVREHQLALLGKASAGHSALPIAPTRAGTTLAGFLPTLVELSQRGIGSRNLKPTGRTLVRSQG